MAIGTRVERAVLTYEHYRELPNDGRRYEIVEGELYVSPTPSTKHQTTTTNVTTELNVHVRAGRLGRVFTAPCDVVFADSSIVQPDVLYVSREQRQIITPANIQGAPDLAVGVISPSTTETDQEIRRDLYAKFGVRHYWVFEPSEERARAFELGADGVYGLVAEARGRETFAAPPCPDLRIALGDVWGD